MATVYPQAVLTKDDGTTYDLSGFQSAVDGRNVQLVPTCNADAHGAGDLIAATEVLAAVTRANDVPGLLIGLTVARLDSTTGVDIRVWFLKANSSFGTESAAAAIADGDIDDILFYVDFAAGDFVSGGATNCFAQKTELARRLIPASGTDDVYIAITATGSVDLGAATDLVLTAHCL